MAKPLIGCGNDFWLKLTPEQANGYSAYAHRCSATHWTKLCSQLEIPYKVTGYQLQSTYGGNAGNELKPEAVIHWRLNGDVPSGFGVGLAAGALAHLNH